ncbi:MAG: patatin-like phospholipase family protein [Myxococcales bacterium]|nr:patatin-like phospholipase family protein [Myxococcales bacterium]
MAKRLGWRRQRGVQEYARRRVPSIVDRAAHTFLRGCPLFSPADPEDLARLIGSSRWLHLKPGEFLFREQEPSTAVYVVYEGLLEVLREQPGSSERIHLSDVRRGAVVGELGVMTGNERTVAVRAVKVSTVLILVARDFVSFVRATPSAGLKLAEMLADRPHPFSHIRLVAQPRGEVWAIERNDDLDSEFAAALARAVWRRGAKPPTVWCAEGARARLAKAHGLKFAPLPPAFRPNPGETAIVLGAGEGIRKIPRGIDALISGIGSYDASVDRHVRLTRSGPLSAGVIRFSSIRIHETAERVVRFLERRTIGLALGGGGALGLCHLGVLEVLARERIPIDFLAGTSAGALLGALMLVRGLDEVRSRATKLTRLQLFGLIDLSFFLSGVMEGRRVQRYFKDWVGRTRIEELPIAYAALALDLETGEERALTSGPLAEALRATVSLASIFSPFVFDGDNGGFPGGTYIDAGGVNNVPVDIARELGSHRTIGVNVINRPQRWHNRRPPWRTWSPIGRGKMISYAEMIGFARNGERQVFTADVAILPDTKDFGFTQFYRAEALAEQGRRAALKMVPQLRALLKPDPVPGD